MADEEKNKIKYLIADTTAFINAVTLNDFAENVLTVPDVITEVRNKRQLRRLCVLPYEMEVREPKPESVKYCVDFSKKTGDYASLSGIDIKVIALTYEMEVEKMGADTHLRKDPIFQRIISTPDTAKTEKQPDETTKLVGWYKPKSKTDASTATLDQKQIDQAKSATDDTGDSEADDSNTEDNIDKVKEEIERLLSLDKEKDDIKNQEDLVNVKLGNITLDTSENTKDAAHVASQEETKIKTDELDDQEENHDGSEGDEDVNEEDEDDNEDEWITPSNFVKAKKAHKGNVEKEKVPIVACVTTDFAIQNVLKQINLNLISLDGKLIKNLRTYILRCYACFKTTSIMTKVFCPNCGNKTLKRVAVSLDENGKQVIHINTRRPLTAKYKNQPLPRFQGGKHSRNPILFEDQPIPRQMPSRVAKTKTNALDEDYIAGFSPFVMRDIDSKSAILRSKGNLKEWARNNTFEEDRRRKHYNRVYK